MHKARLAILAMHVVALGGCASVHIYKATESGLAPDGSRDDGIPFYLPRPYVQVYEPFVVKSEAYLVTGRVSDDGQFLLLEDIPTELASVVKVSPGEARVPAIRVSSIRKTKPTKDGLQNGVLQAKDVDTSTDTPDAPSNAASAASAASQASSAASAANKPDNSASAPTSGKSSLSVGQATTAFLPTLGRRFFDIVWLPDWDEKYILKSSPGLGNSKVAVTMAQGWGLHGVDATLDNEAITKPLIGLYSDSLSALSKLAQSKIFPAGALQSATIEDGKKSSKEPAAKNAQKLTVKVTKVSIAAPGVYPILKPKESADATSIPDKSVAAKVLIPQRPYTNVAFNIYDVIVVEATKPFGDSPMNLQRYIDMEGADAGGTDTTGGTDNANNSGNTNNKTGTQRNITFDEADFIKKANADLATLSANGEGTWVVKTAGATAERLTVNVELTGGSAPAKAPDKASLKQFLVKHSPFKSANSIFIP